MPRLKQVDATINQGPVKRLFPFGGYRNKDGKFIEVDDDAFFYDYSDGPSKESIVGMFSNERPRDTPMDDR